MQVSIAYDLDRGLNLDTSSHSYRYGGIDFGAPSPVLAAWLTVGQQRVDLLVGQKDDLGWPSAVPGDTTFFRTSGRRVGDGLLLGYPPGLTFQDFMLEIGTDVTTLGALDQPGRVEFDQLVSGGRLTLDSYYQPSDTFAFGQMVFAPLSASVWEGIPEPSTWSVLMLGVGSIGLALRRKRGVSGPFESESSTISKDQSPNKTPDFLPTAPG